MEKSEHGTKECGKHFSNIIIKCYLGLSWECKENERKEASWIRITSKWYQTGSDDKECGTQWET